MQPDHNVTYDTYDAAVVAALNEDDAKLIHPGGRGDLPVKRDFDEWCKSTDDVTAKLLCTGYDGERGVILASFNAG
jgi:hypothetical protein